MILNLVRDFDYDLIPSSTYSKKEELRDLDMSYYELKELKNTLSHSKSLYAQMSTDFAN